jgi:hypothetical protein
MHPDLGGPKTYGSYESGFGSGSAKLYDFLAPGQGNNCQESMPIKTYKCLQLIDVPAVFKTEDLPGKLHTARTVKQKE